MWELSGRSPGYRHAQGIEVEIPNGGKVKDLLAALEISESQRAPGPWSRILRGDDTIRCGIPVHVFNAIHGG